VNFGDVETIRNDFEQAHRQRYGFVVEKALIVEAISVEVVGKTDVPDEQVIARVTDKQATPIATVQMYTDHTWHETPVYKREDLQPGDCILVRQLLLKQLVQT
jgi:5-oxoprolinase (ATP-hydrolysing)